MSNWEDIPIREFPERGILWMLEQPNNLQGLVEIVTKEIAEQLDFTQAEQLERTFMSEDLHKLIADVLYKIPFRHAKGWVYVFILVEHQSKTDKTMALRLLAYMLEIWNAQSREWKEKKLPAKEWRLYPIIPIVFYTEIGRASCRERVYGRV